MLFPDSSVFFGITTELFYKFRYTFFEQGCSSTKASNTRDSNFVVCFSHRDGHPRLQSLLLEDINGEHVGSGAVRHIPPYFTK